MPPRINDIRVTSLGNNETDIYIGTITKVNPEKQTMTVSVIGFEGQLYEDIPINQPVSITGAGIRTIPIPGYSRPLLHYSLTYEKKFYHVGYFVEDFSSITQNKSNTKQGEIVFLRYLEPGEVQAISSGKAEVFLGNDGTVSIQSGTGNFLRLSDFYDSLQGQFSELSFDMNSASFVGGRVKRITDAATSNIPEVIRDTNDTAYTEIKMEIGATIDPSTGGPYIQKEPISEIDMYPTVGTFMIASKAFDQAGVAEKILSTVDKDLKVLLKLASGISVAIDEDGSLYVVNSRTESHIKLTTAQETVDGVIEDKSSLEIHINKIDLELKSTGEMKIELTPNDSEEKNTIEISEQLILLQDIRNNKILQDENGILLEDVNGNTVTMAASGVKFEDKNSNKGTMDSAGIELEDKNGNKVGMASSGIQLTTGDAADWKPNTLPNCLFTDAPHSSIVKLTGA